jgi:4a-hydroxytetrahydrobiopterin dehydratase
MDDATMDLTEELGRQQASDAVTGLGWRYMLGVLRTLVRVASLAEALEVSARARIHASGGRSHEMFTLIIFDNV